jgi:hypothetical protein
MIFAAYLRNISCDIYNFSRRFKIFICLLQVLSQNPSRCTAEQKVCLTPGLRNSGLQSAVVSLHF